MNNRVLVLGAGKYQLPLIKKLNELGFYTIAISNKASDPGLAQAKTGQLLSILDFNQIEKLFTKEKISFAITCASDLATITIAHLNKKFKLPGLLPNQIEEVSHKGKFNHLLARLNIPHANYNIINNKTDLRKVKDKVFTYPVIMKPFYSSGSRGIAIAQNYDQIVQNHESVIESSLLEKGYVIQDFIEGVEIGGECLIENYKVAFLEFTVKVNNKHNVPIGHFFPNKISEKKKNDICNYLEKIAKELNIKNSPVNLDTIISDKGILYLIDLSFRLGGNRLPDLIEYKYGINPYERIIGYAEEGFHSDLIVKENPDNFGSVIFHSNEGGIFTKEKFDQIMKLMKCSDILEYSFDVVIGGRVQPFTEGSKRFGDLIGRFKTSKDHQELIEKIGTIV